MSESHWVRLGSCSTGLEADMLRATFEAANIPVQTRSNQAGIFGAAFQGAVVGGIDFYVPSMLLDRAQTVWRESTSGEYVGDDEDHDVPPE